MDFETQIKQIFSGLPKLVDNFSKKIPIWLQLAISENTNFRESSDKIIDPKTTSKSTATKLGMRTGKLYRSFGINDKNSQFKVNKSNGIYNITVGSKLIYADVHERGLFIKGTKKMQKYFWAMYFTHKNIYFKYLALKVFPTSKGSARTKNTQTPTKPKRWGVDIPKRPYYNKSLLKMQEIMNLNFNDDMNNLIKGLNQ